MTIPAADIRLRVSARCAAGFSLVESALAVALAALAVVALFGILPVGLDSVRNAATMTAEARMLQAVAAEYQMRPWASLKTLQAGDTEDFYFDTQGMRVTASSHDRAFTARASILPDRFLPGAVEVNDRLKTIELLVTDRPDANATFRSATQAARACKRLRVSVAQSDKAP